MQTARGWPFDRSGSEREAVLRRFVAMVLMQSGLVRSTVQRLWYGDYQPWVVAIEWLLIGTVVYGTLSFLQGTRGARLLKSVALILVASFIIMRMVAENFGLDRIVFLYKYFVGGVFVVALVVFQPELRRGLLQLGQGWLSRGWWTQETAALVDPIVRAAANLSKKKVGALMAVERGVGLGALVESGVALEAVATSELIESLFWPGGALHDMGVVLRGGRIAAARCQFPLAEHGDVDGALGSRHRAAVGLSQECDAVIVVVSEETGAISVAARGRLRRSLTVDALREYLTAQLQKPKRTRRWRRRPHTKSVTETINTPDPTEPVDGDAAEDRVLAETRPGG